VPVCKSLKYKGRDNLETKITVSNINSGEQKGMFWLWVVNDEDYSGV
jgi:hypothetical protein